MCGLATGVSDWGLALTGLMYGRDDRVLVGSGSRHLKPFSYALCSRFLAVGAVT